VLVVAWTVVVALRAASDLRAVRADIHRLTTGKAPDRTTLERHLDADLKRARAARDSLGELGPTVFGWVPVLGRNVDAERRGARASAAATHAGLTLSRAPRGLGDGHGGVDLARAQSPADALDATATALRPVLHDLATQSTGLTVPPVEAGMREARNQLLGLG